MEAVWARGEVTVRDVHEAVGRQRPLAYTTVMTVMSRLADKGVLRRQPMSSAYVYRPAQSRAEFQASMASRLLKEALDAGGERAIAAFVDLVAEHAPEQIAHLERLLKAKQRGLAGERKAG